MDIEDNVDDNDNDVDNDERIVNINRSTIQLASRHYNVIILYTSSS